MTDQERIAELERDMLRQAAVNEGRLEDNQYVILTGSHYRLLLQQARLEERARCVEIVLDGVDRYTSGSETVGAANDALHNAVRNINDPNWGEWRKGHQPPPVYGADE